MESRSVSRVLSRTVIPLRRPSLDVFSNLPGSSAGHALEPYLVLLRVGFTLTTTCCQTCGALLPHLFTLTGAEALRRLFSVALSVGSRLPGVTWHSALWSPDFPPPLDCKSNKRQRLSNRLSAAKVSGTPHSEQALKRRRAAPQRFIPRFACPARPDTTDSCARR